MNIDRYEIIPISDFDYFFLSKGKKGIIEKRIAFRAMNVPNYFRLSFGDYIDGYIEEDSRTNNQDVDMVLATVAWSIICFTQKDKRFRIKFTGLTKAHTRLFTIWMNKNLDELTKYLNIYGYTNEKCEKFYPNKRYDAFLMSLKI